MHFKTVKNWGKIKNLNAINNFYMKKSVIFKRIKDFKNKVDL